MLPPQEIIAQFPIGRILELQPETRVHIDMLSRWTGHIGFVRRVLEDVFKDAKTKQVMISGDQVLEVIKRSYDAHPYETAISIALTNGFDSGPAAEQFGKISNSCLVRLIWGLVFADLITHFNLDYDTLQCLDLSMLEDPPMGGILIKGHKFTEAQLGRGKALAPLMSAFKAPETSEGFMDALDLDTEALGKDEIRLQNARPGVNAMGPAAPKTPEDPEAENSHVYTHRELQRMTKQQLVDLGVIAKPVAEFLPDQGTYNEAVARGRIQDIPFHKDRLVRIAFRKSGSRDPNCILRDCMKLTGGKLEPVSFRTFIIENLSRILGS